MVESAQQIIESAFKLIGVLGDGTQLTASEYNDALLMLNRMIDRWNLTDLLVYSVSENHFPFISGKQTYTLGTGGDFNIPRPSKIERVSIQYPGSSGTTIELPIDANTDLEHWQGICMKETPSLFPLVMYNDTGFPFMTLKFWPVPQGTANVILYTWDTIGGAQNLTSLLQLPQGYSDAIIYNLAVRLCQMFDRAPSDYLIAEARQAKHDINGINNGTPVLHTDPLFGGGRIGTSDIYKSAGRVAF